MLALPLESTTAALGRVRFTKNGRLQKQHHSFRSVKKHQRLLLNAAINADFQSPSSASFSGDTQVQKLFPRCSTVISPRHARKILVVTAVVKWKRDPSLDKVVQRQKKLHLVYRLRDMLVKQPGRVMKLKDLATHHSVKQSLMGPVFVRPRPFHREDERLIDSIRRFPAVFKVFETAPCEWAFCFTASAEAQYKEEQEIKKQMEDMAVTNLRKLLMMSLDHRILVKRLIHIRRDLGLPDCFPAIYVGKYPEYFRLVQTTLGIAMEINKWDPELAVTYAERKKQNTPENYEEISVSGRVPRFQKLSLPPGQKLSRPEVRQLLQFQQHPQVSPYEDWSHLRPGTMAAEKRVVAVVHEMLHLSLEKKLLVDRFMHFHHDFKFSQQLRSLMLRHPELFYVSLRGDRNTVFLREAYDPRGQLIDEHPLVTCRRKLEILTNITREKMDGIEQAEGHEDGDEDEDGEVYDAGTWSCDEDFHSDTKYFLGELRRRREVHLATRPPVEPW